MENMFCRLEDLHNEADVEQNFARRLIEALDYPDRSIRPKTSLDRLVIRDVGDQRYHKPDFAIKVNRRIRWIVEAKAPGEKLQKHINQARDYASVINRPYIAASNREGSGPVQYYLLTNGKLTLLYRVGHENPILKMEFDEFTEDNQSYLKLKGFLRPDSFGNVTQDEIDDVLHCRKPEIAEINTVFAKCHQDIYTSDKISQAHGFMEFVKLVTLKLISDRRIRDANPGLAAEREFEYPASEVEFSVYWIKKQQTHAIDPVNTILFKRFMQKHETDINNGVCKRFFDNGSTIKLKPETILGVVKKLQGLYLYGIDTDLNGRLFEDFLNATMRGKDLGQFFTPRTVVKLGVGLANLKTGDMVLDGCCGTGGFLIDALADMWGKVDRNPSLSDIAKEKLKKNIANGQIYGIDFAAAPNLAKIARLNMYLHGDGGSKIFNLDGLDLEQAVNNGSDSLDLQNEKKEYIKQKMSGGFNVVLTNPPFSKSYSRNSETDSLILDQYMQITAGKPSVSAKFMFFEAYHHYLSSGGRLISIIDDGFLSGKNCKDFRSRLRQLFKIKAVISLHGDAFQRSEARVKTSFIILEKRSPDEMVEVDPSVFMYPCCYVGIDDPKRKQRLPGDDKIRENALLEVNKVVELYLDFERGQNQENVSKYLVPSDRIGDRLDVLHCLVGRNPHTTTWEQRQYEVKPLHEMLKLRTSAVKFDEKNSDQIFHLLKLGYDGICDLQESRFGKDINGQQISVNEEDIVFSTYNIFHGAIGYVDDSYAGFLASNSYIVARAENKFDALYIWNIMRSTDLKISSLVTSAGMGRRSVKWESIKDIEIPWASEDVRRDIAERTLTAWEVKKQANDLLKSLDDMKSDLFGLDSEKSKDLWESVKPPK